MKTKKCDLEYSQLSHKILIAKLKRKNFNTYNLNISIVVIYAPTIQCSEEEIKKF